MRQSSRNANSPNRSISPIHYVKPSSVLYSSSIASKPKKQQDKTQDPITPPRNLQEAQQNELSLWKSRCNELETSLCQVNTDLELAQYRASKSKALEQKIDDILKQNAQLLGEKDVLNQQYCQKLNESVLWKNKYEQQMNTIIQIKLNYDSEIKRLNENLLITKEQLEKQQEEKYIDCQDQKQALQKENEVQMENIKRSHQKNQTLYEEQVRKLRDLLAEREKYIQEIQEELNQTKIISENERCRLVEQKETLRMKMVQIELVNQKELNEIKKKCENYAHEQLLSLKMLHQSEMNVMENELGKLRKLLEVKNEEINDLISQNTQQKNDFEGKISCLVDENKTLQEKIYESNVHNQEQIKDLQEKLVNLHVTDVESLKTLHENQIRTLLQEQERQDKLIEEKQREKEQILQEKVARERHLENEIIRLNSEIQTLDLALKIQKEERQKEVQDLFDQLKHEEQANVQNIQQLKAQINFLQDEIENLKKSLVNQQNEMQKFISENKIIKNNLEFDLKAALDNLEKQKAQIALLEKDNQQQKEEYQLNILQLNCNFSEKNKKLNAQISILENELKRTKESLLEKNNEVDALGFKLETVEKEKGDIINVIDALNEKIVILERNKAQEIQDLADKLEKLNQFTIENIMKSHANKCENLNNEIKKLNNQIIDKEQLLQEMVIKYEELKQCISDNISDSNNLNVQDYEKKVVNLDAKQATNKTLYDVFVKTRNYASQKNLRAPQ